jgi:hypothetical protein
MSFDGSESLLMWEATRNFAREMVKSNKPVNFTYFVSGVYFLSNENKNDYQAPGHRVGESAIQFSRTSQDILKRIDEMLAARSEGHEIASHLNGHYSGSSWSENDWISEIQQFKKFVPEVGVVGIRTPLLARNENLYKVLPKMGFKYDSSGVGKADVWPVKNNFGTWEIPLVTINIPGINKHTLSMDYNIYLTQTGGKDTLKRNTQEWNTGLSQVIAAYRNYFNNNYKGNRAPVIIGHHFSVWNDGLYWEAMKSFAREVCGKPEVRCTTFSELVKYLL